MEELLTEELLTEVPVLPRSDLSTHENSREQVKLAFHPLQQQFPWPDQFSLLG